MINNVVVYGRLVKDPNVRILSTGSTVAAFTVAVPRKFKDKDGKRGADFISCVAWAKTAELLGQYVFKGDQIGVSGRLQSRTYTGEDGIKRYITEIVVEDFTFPERKQEKKTEGERFEQMGFTEFSEDDIPF